MSLPATVVKNNNYLTAGSQSTLLPLSPAEGDTVGFSDLNDDWDVSNLTLNGNGEVFADDNTSVYTLDLKVCFGYLVTLVLEF